MLPMDTRWKPAVTVATVIERDGAFLVVEEDTPEGVRLNQPAGHLEPGESLVAAAVRETLEETAHAFEPAGLLGVYMSRFPGRNGEPDRSYLRFAFVGDVTGPDLTRPLDACIRRAFWISADALRARQAEHRSPLMQQCVDDYLAARAAGRPWISLDALYTHPSVIGLA
jgi:ADP-ribose pyrophosphatase YjhB (NUDIX family)